MTKICRHHTSNARRSEPRRGAFSSLNPMRGFISILLLVLLLPMPSIAATQNKASSPEPTEERWFQVELILFAHNKGTPLEAESWPEITGLRLPETLHQLHLPEEQAPEGTAALETGAPVSTVPVIADPDAEPPPESGSTGLPETPVAFQLLGEQAFELKAVAEKIARSSRYHSLLHVAWQQPTLDREKAQPIFFIEGMSDPLLLDITPVADAERKHPTASQMLDAGEVGPPNPQFVGTVTLSVERYLHLAVDLLYRRPVTQRLAIPISDLELWYDRPYPTLSEPQGPAFRQESWQAERGFRFVESRRMRSKEIHYLDNPFMGLIVLITPVELPEPAEEIRQTAPQNILQAPRR